MTTADTTRQDFAEIRAKATPEERAFIERTIENMRQRLAEAEAWTDRCWLVGFHYGAFHKEGQTTLVPPHEATQYRSSAAAHRVSARLCNGAGTPSRVVWSERARESYISGLRRALAAWTGEY